MSATRGRGRAAFAAVLAVCVVGAGGYVTWAMARGGDGDGDGLRGASASALRSLVASPYVAFLTSPKDVAPYDELDVAPLAHPSQRLAVGMRCDRVAMNDAMGSCVEHDVGIGVTYTATFFDPSFHEVAHGSGTGIPSRTRLSPSGRLASVTSFTQGDSYLQAGQFSTTTAIFDTRTGRAVVTTLERLHVFRDGKAFDPLNRNFWGVTFVDDRTFYATMASGSTTWLVRGDLRTRTMRTVHENVECPSLAPGGGRVAFKRRVASGAWRFTVLDLATGAETPLAERNSVDDQLAWVDRSTLAYGWQGAVWVVDADGGGRPRVLLRNAQSPTVVRPAAGST